MEPTRPHYLYRFAGIDKDGKLLRDENEKGDALGEFEKRFGSPLEIRSIPAETALVLDVESLVFYCKLSAQMLFARRAGFVHETIVTLAGQPFYMLQRMEAKTSGQDGIEASWRWAYLVPVPVLLELNQQLGDDASDVRRISSWTIERTFVYLDVSDFSKELPGREVVIINTIVALALDDRFWNCGFAAQVQKSVEAMLCIGDGYIFAFRNPVDGVYFGAWLAQLIEELVAWNVLDVPFHFRIGVHTGKVYSFWDPGRNGWNYIGEGINGGNRVLTAVGKETDDVMFVSGQVKSALMFGGKDEFPFGKIRECLHNRGRKADKHGSPWRVYELNQGHLCAYDVARVLGACGIRPRQND